MIRKTMEWGYARTIGAVERWLSGLVESASRRGGLIQVVYVLVIVGLMAGFINAIVFPVPAQNQGLIIYPSGGAQTIPEAIINAFVIFLGGAGIYLAYVSGRQTTRTRTVNLYLVIALLLVAVSVLTGLDIARLKSFG
ncbi:MAG: hypothetical protein HY297_03660 [Thaumarchaeota archaeon]|nr:hypothetical protein [Nitrososphaerota archaeon]